MTALTSENIERGKKNREGFYCSAGHVFYFTGKTSEQKRHEAAEETIRQSLNAEARRRQEAEKRAADIEVEKERVKRELYEVKRTMRKALTTSAHAIKKTRSAHVRLQKQMSKNKK